MLFQGEVFVLSLALALILGAALWWLLVVKPFHRGAGKVARQRPFERHAYYVGSACYGQMGGAEKRRLAKTAARMGLDITDPDERMVFFHELGLAYLGRNTDSMARRLL